MTKPSITLSSIKMGTSRIKKTTTNESDPTAPFHALIMANFSGSKPGTDELKIHQVDRDNYEELFKKIQPGLVLNIRDQNPIIINFNELEDFEPDNLFQNLDVFSQLRALRRRLSNQATFIEASKEIQEWQNTESTSEPKDQPIEQHFEGSLLDSILVETNQRERSKPPGNDIAQNLIQEIITPYIVPKADPKQAEFIQAIDKATSELMSGILHSPHLQTLEGAWRGLYSLIKNVETSKDLKLFILDIDQCQLAENIDNDDVSATSFYKKVIEPYHTMPGATPWSVWLGDYTISDAADDIFFLERMGKLAQLANVTFISSASPQLVSCESLAKTPDPDDWQLARDNKILTAWEYIRQSDLSKHIALSFPRVLGRLPYGKKNRPIANFDYEEMPHSTHDHYLWIGAGYALLTMLAESYTNNKWQFKPGMINEISGLPTHVYDNDGDKEIKPCAEILLTERASEQIKNFGIMPVWSVKEQDKIRIGPMISFHIQPQLIYGNWVN